MWKVFLTVNPQLSIDALILDIILGGLLFMTIGAFINALRKKSVRRPGVIIMGIIGMLLGGYWQIFHHNAMMEMAGHFTEEPDYYEPAEMCRQLKFYGDKKQNVVIFYAAGALATPGGFPVENYASLPANTFVFAHSDEKKLARAIDAVPVEFKVVLLGHSTGGATALRAAHMCRRQIDWLVTMDAMEMDFISKYVYKNSGKPANVKFWQNLLPHNWKNLDRSTLTDQDSDYWATGNPLRMMEMAGAETVFNSPDHGMLRSGLRRHWDVQKNYGGIYEIRSNVISKLDALNTQKKVPFAR